MKEFKKLFTFLVITLAMYFVMSSPAQALTFTFDYYTVPPHVDPHTPIGPGGPWGTLTITENANDFRRVDFNLTITPPPAYAGATLEQFYLNFDTNPADSPGAPNDPDFLAGTTRFLVPITNGFGDTTGSLGSVGYTNGATQFDLANFVFDLNPNPTSGAQTFIGSLALSQSGTFFDLNPDMFDVPSVFAPGGTGGPQTIPMYAAYRTNNFNVNPNDPNFPDGEFWAFASKPNVIPEPATMALLGAGLLGLARARKRIRLGRN